MQAEIIRIGNSQGLRLPKALLEQCGFEKAVELRVEGNCIIVEPVSNVRAGWSEAFQQMALSGDDASLLDETISNAFDEDEWTW